MRHWPSPGSRDLSLLAFLFVFRSNKCGCCYYYCHKLLLLKLSTIHIQSPVVCIVTVVVWPPQAVFVLHWRPFVCGAYCRSFVSEGREMGGRHRDGSLVRPNQQTNAIGLPSSIVVLLLILINLVVTCQSLADGTHTFNSGATGQNEMAQLRTFGGAQSANNGQVASSVASNWEGSGANPDDEDGDVDEEGSGDGGQSAEGSGSPPEGLERERRPINQSMPVRPNPFGDDDQRRQQYANATPTVADVHNLSPIFGPSTTRAVPTIAAVSTTTTTTVLLVTTLRPPLFKPLTTVSPTTTPFSSSQSVSKLSPKTTTPNTTSNTTQRVIKPVNEEEGWPQPPKSTMPPFMAPPRTTKKPFFIADPSSTLEQLRPGIFAFMVGGVVVGLLLLILIISYLVYRLKKRDEGTYICEEPHQPTHYPYAYQKASIREFYA